MNLLIWYGYEMCDVIQIVTENTYRLVIRDEIVVEQLVDYARGLRDL